ncbi:hypothetical protein [Micromonospora sp. NPDC049497]|uniref:hypothetical protein n=1 Tax=Micromonospora sp. NPDC049497 TaxID=3364273 RepID=UPI00379FF4A2
MLTLPRMMLGSALQADVDLFVNWQPRADFPTAVDEVITVYRAEGFRVDIDLRLDTFARLHVADPTHPDQQHRVELVANWRTQPPAMVTNPILVRTVSRPGPPSTHSVQLPTLRIDPGANRSWGPRRSGTLSASTHPLR